MDSLEEVKWLARMVNQSGSWGPRHIRVVLAKRPDVGRAICILTRGCSGVYVRGTTTGEYDVVLDGVAADDWIALAKPYLSSESGMA